MIRCSTHKLLSNYPQIQRKTLLNFVHIDSTTERLFLSLHRKTCSVIGLLAVFLEILPGEQTKMQTDHGHELAMEIAAFRFSVIADFVNGGGLLQGMGKSRSSYKKKVTRAIKFQAAPGLEYQFPP